MIVVASRQTIPPGPSRTFQAATQSICSSAALHKFLWTGTATFTQVHSVVSIRMRSVLSIRVHRNCGTFHMRSVVPITMLSGVSIQVHRHCLPSVCTRSCQSEVVKSPK